MASHARHLGSLRVWVIALALASVVLPAGAAITPAPASVSVFPTQLTGVVTLTITFSPPTWSGSSTINFTQAGGLLPPWLTTVPNPVTFSFASGSTSATSTFRFQASAAAVPGSYTINMAAVGGPPPAGVGIGTMMLQIRQPSFTASVTPNPLSLRWGGAQNVTVTTIPDPGFTASLSYSFSGFPPGIATGIKQTVSAPYPPATFPFGVGVGTAPGTYTGTLAAVTLASPPQIINYPMAVIVQPPDVVASLSQPSVSVCNGGPAAGDAIVLSPASGYVGTPQLGFTVVPAGITISPVNPVANPMPPGQSVPFTVAATGASAGAHLVTLRVSDPAAGIDKTIQLTVNVADPDFTPAVSPPSVTLTPGGSSVSLTAFLTPNACFSPPVVTVTPMGAPAGVTFTPSSVTLAAPAYAAAGFAARAAPGAAPGTYPVGFSFQPSVGTAKSVTATLLVVAAPDFTLAVTPATLALAGGSTGTVNVAAAGLNGFAGAISVSSPTLPGVVFSPAAFTLLPGASQAVTVQAGTTAQPGTTAAAFSGTAAGIAGARTATLSLTIAAPPDFALAVDPPALSLALGSSATVTVAASGLGGFSGVIGVTAPTAPGVTFTPSGFALAPGASQPVAVQVAPDAPPGTSVVSFSGTAAGITGLRTASFALTITAPPDFTIAVAPGALALVHGTSALLTVSATGLNGFAGPIAVTAPNLAGTTFEPASFTLACGGSRAVTVRVSHAAALGASTCRFSGMAAGVPGQRTALLALSVAEAAPLILSVTPPTMAAGTANVLLRLTGENFLPGAIASSPTAGMRVVGTTVLSQTLAEVLVSVRADAASGPYRIDLTNPDGARTSQGVVVLVYPTASLGAPLGVTAAAIVFPRPFTLIAPDHPVYPHGLLATTGLGTIVGSWRYDGVPFDRFAVNAAGGMPVEVRANVPLPTSFAGEHRLELAVELPQLLVTEPVSVIQSVESRSQLEILAPADGVVFGDPPPLFRWSIVPGASGYRIEIERESDRLARTIRLSASEWRPGPRDVEKIGPGEHRLRVRAVFPGEVDGEPTAWLRFVIPGKVRDRGASLSRDRPSTSGAGFRLASLSLGSAPASRPQSPAEVQQPETGVAEGSERPPGEWQLSLLGTGTDTRDEGEVHGDAFRLQLTGQADVARGRFEAKGTGDLGERHDFEAPHQTVAESRNWQFQLGTSEGGYRQEAMVGYSPPDFLDQSEFLSAGLARGGAQAKLATPAGSLSYYQTFSSLPAGAVGGPGLAQDIKGIAVEAPWDPTRFLLRAVALRTDVAPSSDLAGVRGEAVGVLGRFAIGPGLTLLFEGARGEVKPHEEGASPRREGYGFHLGANGMLGTFSYTVNLRKTDADFANPANLGLTPGAVPDRVGGDLSLAKSFGGAMLSVQLRRLQSGSGSGAQGPKVVEDGGVVNLMLPLGPKVTVAVAGTLTTTEGDEDPRNLLPAVSRRQRGATLTFTESPGLLSFSQGLSWQEMRDRTFASADQDVKSATLAANGALTQALTLSALASGTRTEGSAAIGRIDQILLSLQPTIAWAVAHLTVTPRAAYIEVESEVGDVTSKTEQLQLMTQWSPPWAGSLVNLQLAADWSRSWTNRQPSLPPFTRRIVATFTLRWGGQNQAAQPAAPPPVAPSIGRFDPLRPGLLAARL